MLVYVVKAGDNLAAIAKQHGFKSAKELYDHPSNAGFRSKRPNPDLIFPGDQINIPTGMAGVGSPHGESRPFRMAIIDGTGPADGVEYDLAMQKSFCSQLGRALGHKISQYKRGPSTIGKQVPAEAKEAYDFLKLAHDSDPTLRLMLAGYSRGGSAAIMAAELLEKDKIDVDSMFLFDAVARHWFPAGVVIPANVRFSRHARRDLNALLVLKYEASFSEVPGINASNPMRPTFGNTGLNWRGDGDHELATPFRGSHGALGGVGWPFVVDDPNCQSQVSIWMNSHLKKRGVGELLKSIPPTPGQPAATPSLTEIISGWSLDALLLARHKWNLAHAGQIE